MSASETAPTNTFSPFLPVCLVALSVLIFLAWQTTAAVRQHSNLLRLSDRQELLASQAAQTETQLQSLMMDLLQLAQSDDDAQAIITKYNIKFNPPSAAVAAADGPAATPAAGPAHTNAMDDAQSPAGE